MTTTTIDNKLSAKPNFKLFFSNQIKNVGDSIGDMIVAVAITGITITYMMQIIPAVYASTIPGLYLFGMLVQLFIRIVHRFDDSYTNDELAERILEVENKIAEVHEDLKVTIKDEPGLIAINDRLILIEELLKEIDLARG
jgi:hypothetical protein